MLPGYHVVLTREDDRDLSLSERARIANHSGCRLLVSLHVNGSVQARMSGIELYYLDTLKARLPRRLRETVGKRLDDPTLIVRELRARHLAESSAALAGTVNEAMVAAAKTLAPEARSNGTRHDLLQLLLGAEIPSVLVEVGYLSNPTERAHLLDNRYQKTLAHGIARRHQEFPRPRPLRYVIPPYLGPIRCTEAHTR